MFQPGSNEHRRRPELRTRIFSLAAHGHIVNKIPREVDVNALEYRLVDRRLMVTDTKNFSLDINEFGLAG